MLGLADTCIKRKAPLMDTDLDNEGNSSFEFFFIFCINTVAMVLLTTLGYGERVVMLKP